ncbi:MAG: hypothetical protein KTR32_35010 [Granulosicoccus sp.]|nr:hypothetical protein [Granulosicoccus sp.]
MSQHDLNPATSEFDPEEKEKQLREESNSWDTTQIEDAQPGDIPVLDLSEYFETGSKTALNSIAQSLKTACEEVGFFSIVGHQVGKNQMQQMFETVRQFHALPLEVKQTLLMDRPDWPIGGVGYMPVKNRKLPSRDKPNLNEAFIVKCDNVLTMDDNQWPEESQLPKFRETVERYANTLENLGRRLMPIYATALNMPETFFDAAFTSPLYRLRMTHYPPLKLDSDDDFGIAPHVDTTFCTILAQDQPGLSIFSERRQIWVNAPALEDAFIVNTGELLKQWTNDRFLSVKHFANNNLGDQSRYSIPFFLNANPDYKMTYIESCCGPDNPPKYPPISYNESQATVQGE